MEQTATDTLVRAARELLRWDQKMLAEKSGVGLATVRRFETGANTQAVKIDAIVRALNAAGVAFLRPDSPSVAIAGGVALTPAGRPLERPEKLVYKKRRKRAKAPPAGNTRTAATPRRPKRPA